MARTVATPIDERWAWADRGSCQGLEDVFYNEEEDGRKLRRHKERLAKMVCDRCPVVVECRQYAMDAGELYGVWGGLSEMERHELAGRMRTG